MHFDTTINLSAILIGLSLIWSAGKAVATIAYLHNVVDRHMTDDSVHFERIDHRLERLQTSIDDMAMAAKSATDAALSAAAAKDILERIESGMVWDGSERRRGSQ